MDLIFAYTRDDAINDGILLRLEQFIHDAGVSISILEALTATNRACGNFEMGELIITANAANVLGVGDVVVGLLRHQLADWTELCDEDLAENKSAMRYGSRILSVYTTHDDRKYWIITEWNREATTVMLPEDY